MILIKDTHVKRSGGVGNALKKPFSTVAITKISKLKSRYSRFRVRRSPFIFTRPIMLDNMSIADMQKCVSLIKERNVPVETEASGNITLATIESVAKTGVDFISSGALTHSAAALDIHLVID